MTAPLAPEAAEDGEELLVAWLAPLRRAAISRRVGDPLPFTLVRQIGGEECEEEFSSSPLLSVRTLCDKTLGEDAAKEECALTHRRMLLLAREVPDITLSGGRIANVDYVKVIQTPIWVPFEDDQILCKIARYALGLTYTATT